MWITEELDDGRGFLIGKAVDDEPFLSKGCAMHGNVKEVADGATASITGEQISTLYLPKPIFCCADGDNHARFGLLEALDGMPKANMDAGKAFEAVEQGSFKIGLEKGGDEGMAVSLTGGGYSDQQVLALDIEGRDV